MTYVMRRFESQIYWGVPQEWAGETAFVVAGGPSVLDIDLEQLRGRNVIVINSSIYPISWAQYRYFGDFRWWNEPENQAAVAKFSDRVVTTSLLVRNPKVLICRKAEPPGLSLDREMLAQKWTSLTAATNLAMHL